MTKIRLGEDPGHPGGPGATTGPYEMEEGGGGGSDRPTGEMRGR